MSADIALAPRKRLREPSRNGLRADFRDGATSASGRWYRSLTAPVRAHFAGFAVTRHGVRVQGDTRTWSRTCALADRVGGQVALWTTAAPPGAPDDSGNVGNENDIDRTS